MPPYRQMFYQLCDLDVGECVHQGLRSPVGPRVGAGLRDCPQTPSSLPGLCFSQPRSQPAGCLARALGAAWRVLSVWAREALRSGFWGAPWAAPLSSSCGVLSTVLGRPQSRLLRRRCLSCVAHLGVTTRFPTLRHRPESQKPLTWSFLVICKHSVESGESGDSPGKWGGCAPICGWCAGLGRTR